MNLAHATVIALIPLMCSGAAGNAQPTYKCTVDGKTSYSDAPCKGATIVDTTPTQGMDKMSGQRRTGTDVQRIENRKIMDNALKPLTGKSTEEMDAARRRINMTATAKLQCALLDDQIGDKSPLDSDTRYKARVKYKDLGC